MSRARTILAGLSLLAAACKPAASPTSPSPAPTSGPGVVDVQIDGVWVFTHAARDSMDALHGGVPEIVDGCLVVDGLVVVWRDERIAEAKAAVRAAKAEDETPLRLAGGGISRSEGADASAFPRAVLLRCPNADGVWFQAS
jgi:hypothetical protein